MFNLVSVEEGEEEPPEIPAPRLMVQVMSSERIISVFSPTVEEPIVRWAPLQFFCKWKGTFAGHNLEISVVEGLWFEVVVRHYLFIHCDEKVVWWVSIPHIDTRDIDLNGQCLDRWKEPIYGTLWA